MPATLPGFRRTGGAARLAAAREIAMPRRSCFALTLAACAALAAPAALGAPAAAQSEPGWTTYRSQDGRFSVLFPAAPSRDDKPVATGPGSPGSYSIFTAKGAGGIWMAGFADYAPGFDFGIQAELEANRDNFVKGTGAVLTESRPLKLGSAPGLEFTADKAGQWTARGRVFIVGRRPYQLLAIVPPGDSNAAHVRRFLDSFAVDGTR